MAASYPAANEHRDRWLTTIAVSFPRLVLWRAAKNRYNEIGRTIKKLNLHLPIIAADLDRLWRGPAVLVQCRRLRTILESLEHGYMAAMSWLEGSITIDDIKISNWQNPDFRAHRDFILKQLAIFQRRFDQVIDLFAYLIDRTSADPDVSDFHHEARLGDFISRAEWTFNKALDIIQQYYNSGQLFAEFARAILDEITVEKEFFAKRRKVYPYPSPKLVIIDEEDSETLREFRPLLGVSRIEDDEYARLLLF